jgi:hypothetical protein
VRVAVFVVTVLVVTTPSEASQSCMSKTEARQHFGAVHIYWHPPDHCWDASPTKRRQIPHSVQRTLHKIDQVQQQAEQPKGQDLMSMASDDEAVRPTLEVDRHASTPWVERWVDIETSPLVARWVDIAPVAPPPINERKPEPMVRPLDLVLLLFAIGLTVGTMKGQNQRPHSRKRYRNPSPI